MSVLKKDDRFAGYVVQNLLKENVYSETYRVVDDNDEAYFLKLFCLKNMPEKMLEQGIVKEIVYCKCLKHTNLISHIKDGQERLESGDYQYLVTNYFSGELLIEKIEREGRMELEAALNLFMQILEGVKYMHEQRPPLIHNDITPANIMLSAKTGGVPELIDMGHVSERSNGNPKFDGADLDPFYRANETFIGVFDEQSDVFSACAVLFTMLTGKAPWLVDLPMDNSLQERGSQIRKYRQNHSLDFNGASLPQWLQNILRKGLSPDYQSRYESVEQLTTALRNREESAPAPGTSETNGARKSSRRPAGQDAPQNNGNPGNTSNHGSPGEPGNSGNPETETEGGWLQFALFNI